MDLGAFRKVEKGFQESATEDNEQFETCKPLNIITILRSLSAVWVGGYSDARLRRVIMFRFRPTELSGLPCAQKRGNSGINFWWENSTHPVPEPPVDSVPGLLGSVASSVPPPRRTRNLGTHNSGLEKGKGRGHLAHRHEWLLSVWIRIWVGAT